MGTNSLAMLSKHQTCHQNSFRFKEISRRTSLMQHCTRSVLWVKHTKRQLEQAVLVSGAHAFVCRGNAQPDVDASIARGDAAALAFVVVIAKIHSTKQSNECQFAWGGGSSQKGFFPLNFLYKRIVKVVNLMAYSSYCRHHDILIVVIVFSW